MSAAPPPFIGRSLLRYEDARFLTGTGCYVDDLVFDGMLHAAVFRSPVAHAAIRGIDVSGAISMPGVMAVFIDADLGSPNAIPLRMPPLPGYERSFLQFPLARGKVRYVGEPVALVVADSAYRAEDALDHIRFDFDELPAVTDWASASGSHVLHEHTGTNVASHYQVGRGNIRSAFETAPYRRKERFRCHRQTAVPMETRGLIAAWNADTQHLTVWGAAKMPFTNRRILANLIGLPESSIDLIEVDIGGGFGVRGEFYPEDFLIPFAARKLGAPVKWIEDRREHLMATNHAREVDCELEIACAADGRILGLDGRIMVDLGAYVRTNASVPPSNVAAFLPGPYRIDNFSCEVNVFTSNKTPIGSYRGPGRFEANFFRERLLDQAAQDLRLDPADMRRRNLLTPAELPYEQGALIPALTSSPYDSGDYSEPLIRVLQESGWTTLLEQSGRLIDGWYHGVGLSCFVESGGAGPREHARLVVRDGGTIDCMIGCSALGQGHETTFAQIAADALGLAPDRIRVLHGSTTYLDAGFGTYGGRSAVMGGGAILDAATHLIDSLRQTAMRRLGQPNLEMIWKAGAFHNTDGDVLVTLAELAADVQAQEPIAADGDFANTRLTYSYGTNVAHVAVDPATGRVRVIDYWAVEDIGRAINPLIVHGQMIGGLVQGLGATFLDELIYDDSGQLLNASLADYLLPTASDFPNIHCLSLENARSTTNPLGVKAAGEGGIVAVAATVANAVSAALAPLGIQMNALPLSPVRVWQAIVAAQQAAGKDIREKR